VFSDGCAALLNMAAEPLAVCYPGRAGGTLRAGPNASIQNNSGWRQGLAGRPAADWKVRKTERAGQSAALTAHRGESPHA
jgi:hypothetical protein